MDGVVAAEPMNPANRQTKMETASLIVLIMFNLPENNMAQALKNACAITKLFFRELGISYIERRKTNEIIYYL